MVAGLAVATAKLQTPGTSVFRRHDVERYFLAQLAHSEADAANLSGI